MSNLFSRDSWAEIIEALSSNWFRTVLTAFGVLWGIFILVILLAAGNGLENGVKQGFSGMATNSMFMWTQGTSKPYKGLPKGRYFSFKLNDVETLKAEIISIDQDSRKIGLSSKLVKLRDQKANVDDYVKKATATSKTTMGDVFGDALRDMNKDTSATSSDQ